MRVLISSEGSHDPPGHLMVVAGLEGLPAGDHALVLDLSKCGGTLVDPTIVKATWGMVLDGATWREGGIIVRLDGSQQRFYEVEPLMPYLAAWVRRWIDLRNEHQAVVAAQADDANLTEAFGPKHQLPAAWPGSRAQDTHPFHRFRL